MKTLDVLLRAGGNLKRAKVRTLLTALAISVGGFAIMVSLAAGVGAKQYVDRVISANMNPQSISIGKDKRLFGVQSTSSMSGLREYSEDTVGMFGTDFKTLDMKDIDTLKARKDIYNVEPYYQVQPKYVSFSIVPGKKYITQVEAYQDTLRQPTVAGSLPAVGVKLADGVVAIPESFLEGLKISDPQKIIGTDVTINIEQVPQAPDVKALQQAFASGGEAAVKELTKGKTLGVTYKVGAVIKKTPEQMMAPSSLVISSQSAKYLTDFSTAGTPQYQKYLLASAMVKDGDSPEKIKESLAQVGYSSATAKDAQSMLFTFVNILQSIVLGFGLLALIVSIFGIINTQYISVLERTQQIGLMKSLGARSRDIAKLFRYEAMWVGFIGGLIGVVGAWGIGTLVNPLITDKLNLGSGNHLLVFEPIPAIGIVVGLMVVAAISGWFPSRKAAKLDPIEALRVE